MTCVEIRWKLIIVKTWKFVNFNCTWKVNWNDLAVMYSQSRFLEWGRERVSHSHCPGNGSVSAMRVSSTKNVALRPELTAAQPGGLQGSFHPAVQCAGQLRYAVK